MPLADPEESRCAVIVREMLQGGDWIVPHLGGKAYFDKPAPFFWLAAAGQCITGSAELGGRLIAAVAAMLAVLVTYAFGRRLFGAPAGLVGGLVLATSGEFLFMARWYRMDMPFVAAMWAAIWWLWRAGLDETASAAGKDRWRGWIGFYLFAGIATIFKGPAGLGLPALVVVVWLLLTRRPRRLVGLLHPVGIALYLLVAGPWYVAVIARQPGYAYEFFIRQNLLRYAGGGHLGHSWPGILYVPILLAGLLPWTIYLPGAVIRYFPRKWRQISANPGVSLLWLTAIVTVGFFAFSRTKLLSYILPAFAPLAVLIGGLVASWFRRRQPDRLMQHGARTFLVTVLLLPLIPAGIEIWLGNIDLWIALPFVVSAVAAWQMWTSRRGTRRRGRLFGWGAVAVVTMYLFLIIHTAPVAYEFMSTRSLARLIPLTNSKKDYCFWSNKKWSYIFYTHARRAEKFHRSRPEDIRRLARWMASPREVYCLVSGDKQMRSLAGACTVALRVLGRAGRCWLVTNVPPPAAGPSASRPSPKELPSSTGPQSQQQKPKP